jgi:amidohydrolase
MDIKIETEKYRDFLISLRRHFHENPELSQQEFKTMDTIEAYLKEWHIPSVRVPHGGVLGFLDGKAEGLSVLMRADIDALPIMESEENLRGKRVCRSHNPGVMHACGHDGHMAMLLTETRILADHRDEWDGHVILMFEEAEEMGERGVGHLLQYIKDHHIAVDTCFGTHVLASLPAGQVAILDGPAMAGAFFYEAVIHGKGGHGSRPDLSRSPIETFISFGNELRSYVLNAVSSTHILTYSFGSVNAGDTPNVIPDTLRFAGTARTLNNEDGLAFRTHFWDLFQETCHRYGCEGEVTFDQYFPVTFNHPACAAFARKAVTAVIGEEAVVSRMEPRMSTETFSITESVWPGVFFFTGIQDKETGSGAGHHTDRFDIGEEGLVTGTEAALAYVIALLESKPEFNDFKPADLDSMLKLAE